MSRIVLVEFPGSSVEELVRAYTIVSGSAPEVVWHTSEQLPSCDLLVIPGGSSFCDYLRPGALAKTSPIAMQIRRFARSGKILGIGNGFQILCELGLLPGVLLPNIEATFLSDEVFVTEIENGSSMTPGRYQTGKFPLACEAGRYFADHRLLDELKTNKQIAFLYTDSNGLPLESPPTGSVGGVAGVTNEQGNVLGVMFHPERAVEEHFGGVHGREILLCRT